MAAQAEVDRQDYAHKISERQKETHKAKQDRDMLEGEEAERVRLQRVAQRRELDLK